MAVGAPAQRRDRSSNPETLDLATAVERAAPRQLPFVASIGLSAFLLFSLELLAGRLVLPVFGGSPAVWTTGLCFFTGVLFVGYLYAHLLVTRLTPDRAATVHLVVAAVAIALAALAPSDVASLRVPGLADAANVLLALAIIAGPAAFLLAATTPLLSAWYAGRGGNPWWLYATSNGASFVALLAYPILIEPLVPLSAQRVLFVAGVVALVGFLTAVVRSSWQGSRPAAVPVRVRRIRIPARRQALWLSAAFVPAGLLSATTNFLQTDLISAPLIWIGPLAIYLASFVVAFSARGRRWIPHVDRLVPAAATLLWVPFVQPGGWPVIALLVVELGSFAVLAIAIHGHLAYDLPDDGNLTRFYLVLSAGGMLATAFVALVAPQAFSTVLEYPLLIVAGLAVLTLLPRQPSDPANALDALPKVSARRPRPLRAAAGRLLPYAAIGAILVVLIGRQDAAVALTVLRLILIGAIAILVGLTPRLLAAGTAVLLALAVVTASASPLLRVRTFFGVVEVRDVGGAHVEVSGTTIHGVQFADERRHEPTAYYVRPGPFGEAFADLDARTSAAHVGVVGLGVGTVAAYVRPADRLTFFEIDPAVVTIARDPRWFTYLPDAPAVPDVIVGDARLSLLDVPAASYDLLVLDAFSSDSVPAHLLTREAIASYVRTLRPGGVLLFHLSNRYYDLVPAVASTAESVGLTTATRTYVPPADVATRLEAGPTIVVVAGDAADVARFRAHGWQATTAGPLLTDDYSDLLRTLRLSGL